MASRVPAWKRLGLKLKYATEQPEHAEGSQQDRIIARKGASERSSEPSERPAKRQRLAKPVATNGFSTHDEVRANSEQGPPAQQSGRHSSVTEDAPQSGKHAMKRRKSVTFTDDTKVDDGDTRVTIDFPAVSPGQTPKKAKSVDADVVPTETAGSPFLEGSSSQKKKKPKAGKKSKAKQQQSKDKSSPALDYLKQHRYDRASWKFNKNRDVWILNRALNTDTVPISHTLALAGYVRGLPERAAAKARLVQECREALEDARFEGDGSEQNKIQLMYLLGNTSDETEADLFLQRHSRPAILLWALGESIDDASNAKSSGPGVTHRPSEPAKRRKSRTSAPIDISSSSEEDSDDDSSDSSNGSSVDGGTRVKTNGLKVQTNGKLAATDGTSSTGSSSSSSEDDSDSTSSDELSSDSD